MYEKHLKELLTVLNDPSAEKSARRQAAAELGNLRDASTIQPLLEAACNLQAAEEALATMGDMVALAMVTARDDPNPKIQRTAQNVLVRLGYDPDHLPPEMQAITHLSASVEDLVAAAEGHDEIGVNQAVQALIPAGAQALEPTLLLLWHENSEVRAAAVRVLREIRDPRALDALLDALHDPDAGVRLEAVQGLAKSGERRAIHPLADVVRNEGEGSVVRLYAALGVGELTGDDMLSLQAAAVLDTALKNGRFNEAKLQELLWMIDEALAG